MSHIKVLDCEFKDVGVLGRTCEKRQIPFEAAEAGKTLTRKLYEGTVRGLAAFRLKGWKYDAVVQKDGTCKADNYNGAWGDPAELDALKQGYALQSARDRKSVV